MADVMNQKPIINPRTRSVAASTGPVEVGPETLAWDRRFGIFLGATIGVAIIAALGIFQFAM